MVENYQVFCANAATPALRLHRSEVLMPPLRSFARAAFGRLRLSLYYRPDSESNRENTTAMVGG